MQILVSSLYVSILAQTAQVADWKTFWAMFNNWLWVYQTLVYYEENKLGLDPDVEEQLEWLQIDSLTISGSVGMVSSPGLGQEACIWKHYKR